MHTLERLFDRMGERAVESGLNIRKGGSEQHPDQPVLRATVPAGNGAEDPGEVPHAAVLPHRLALQQESALWLPSS